MKGDIYYLKNPRGYIVAKFEQTDDYMTGVCYECSGWGGSDLKDPCDWSFFADVYCKYDSCTHWNFFGEDYNPNTKEGRDSYYHICGDYCFLDHVRMMCFVWKIAEDILVESCGSGAYNTAEYTREAYSGSKKLKHLVDYMLDGYTIEKGDKK